MLGYLPIHAIPIGGRVLPELCSVAYTDSVARLSLSAARRTRTLLTCVSAGVGLTVNDDAFQGEAKIAAQTFNSHALVGQEVARQRLLDEMLGTDVIQSGCNIAWLDPEALIVGLQGLPAAFLQAGATTVISAHWPVSAVVSLQIVHAFYRALATPGTSAAEALRAAQLGMLTKPYYQRHTYYWDPFSLVGDWQ